jgi:hypothetical protein
VWHAFMETAAYRGDVVRQCFGCPVVRLSWPGSSQSKILAFVICPLRKALMCAVLYTCALCLVACLQDAYDWAGARVVLDVGGGRGELLSSVMSWAGQQCRGLLLDRQMVIDRWARVGLRLVCRHDQMLAAAIECIGRPQGAKICRCAA